MEIDRGEWKQLIKQRHEEVLARQKWKMENFLSNYGKPIRGFAKDPHPQHVVCPCNTPAMKGPCPFLT